MKSIFVKIYCHLWRFKWVSTKSKERIQTLNDFFAVIEHINQMLEIYVDIYEEKHEKY